MHVLTSAKSEAHIASWAAAIEPCRLAPASLRHHYVEAKVMHFGLIFDMFCCYLVVTWLLPGFKPGNKFCYLV